jgi:hypothetical protein
MTKTYSQKATSLYTLMILYSNAQFVLLHLTDIPTVLLQVLQSHRRPLIFDSFKLFEYLSPRWTQTLNRSHGVAVKLAKADYTLYLRQKNPPLKSHQSVDDGTQVCIP